MPREMSFDPLESEHRMQTAVHWENTYKDAFSIQHNTTYSVRFRVRGAAIKPGQVIGVLGSIPGLDKWK